MSSLPPNQPHKSLKESHNIESINFPSKIALQARYWDPTATIEGDHNNEETMWTPSAISKKRPSKEELFRDYQDDDIGSDLSGISRGSIAFSSSYRRGSNSSCSSYASTEDRNSPFTDKIIPSHDQYGEQQSNGWAKRNKLIGASSAIMAGQDITIPKNSDRNQPILRHMLLNKSGKSKEIVP